MSNCRSTSEPFISGERQKERETRRESKKRQSIGGTHDISVTFSNTIVQLQLHTPIHTGELNHLNSNIQSLHLSLKSNFLKASEKLWSPFSSFTNCQGAKLIITCFEKHKILVVNIGLNYLLKWTFLQCAPRPGSKPYLKSWKTDRTVDRACQTNTVLSN